MFDLRTTISKIKRRRIIRRKKAFLDSLLRTSRTVGLIGPIEEVTLSSDHEEEETVEETWRSTAEVKPRCPLTSSTPSSAMPRLTQEQFEAMFIESSSSSEEEEEEEAQLILPRGDQPVPEDKEDGTPPSPTSGDQPDPEDEMHGSKDSSQYHPTTPLSSASSEEEDGPPEVISEDEEPQAGPSGQQRPGILRYPQYNIQPTYIHGHTPIMSPQVLVRCPPLPPCPPFRPHSPPSPPRDDYLHPRPPTPHPPSPSPPPAPPTPEVYLERPPVPEVPEAPAVPPPPFPLPWWTRLVQDGPHQVASISLIHRYLTLLEFTVDIYM